MLTELLIDPYDQFTDSIEMTTQLELLNYEKNELGDDF